MAVFGIGVWGGLTLSRLRSPGGTPAAEAIDLVAMALDHESEIRRDFVLDALDLRARELEDLATRLADEVIVMSSLVLSLEPSLSLEDQLLSEPGCLEELEGPVDRGAADVGTLLLDHLKEVIDRQVLMGTQEGIQDHLALLASLEMVLSEVCGEHLFLFARGILHDPLRLVFGANGCQRT
jgi:hypothetical protein